MTNFRRINLEEEIEIIKPKGTIFYNSVNSQLEITTAVLSPEEYENVIHIGEDINYGDVFIAYDDDPNDFTVFFGEAGDEFKEKS